MAPLLYGGPPFSVVAYNLLALAPPDAMKFCVAIRAVAVNIEFSQGSWMKFHQIVRVRVGRVAA